MTFPKLKEARDKYTAKQDELGAIFAEAREGGDGTIDLSRVKSIDTDDVAAEIAKRNDELADLKAEIDKLEKVANAAALADEDRTEGGDPEPPAAKTVPVGKAFIDSAAYKARTGGAGPETHLDIDVKTLFQTTAGWTPENLRSGLVVDNAQRPVQVTDLIPTDPTTQAAFVYMEETTFTNNAAEASEGGTYGEAALALTERTSTVRKIGVWLPVTDEQLEDEPMAESYVNRRLPFMVRQRLDSQILVGNGTAPNLEGVNNVSGTNSQAKGTDPVPDAVYKGIRAARVTGRAMPDAVIFHPNDWQDVRLLRTSDGVYIWGNPSEAGPERIWGLRVVQSDAQTENTAVAGDFANFSVLALRRGLDVQVTNSHSTHFIEGKQAIRADLRAALAWTRPAAFSLITGL